MTFALSLLLLLLSLLHGAAAQDVMCMANRCPPTMVHTMLRPDGTSVHVLWQTFARTAGNSTVWLGTSPGKYTLALDSQREQSITQSEAGYNVLFDHLVDLPGLPPLTTFYYRVGDPGGSGTSDELSFTTGPAPGGRVKGRALQMQFAFFGDMGLANSQATIGLLETLASTGLNGSAPIDFVIHGGDIGYGDQYPAYMYERVWQQFFANMEPVMSRVPYMVAPGNHEFGCGHDECEEDTRDFRTYGMRFALPVRSYGGLSPMWYAFQRGNVQFVVTSTETDYPRAFFDSKFGDQLKWLDATLAAAVKNRANVPWIFVIGHRPIYSTDNFFVDCDKSGATCWPKGDSAIVQAAFEPLFVKYGVDVVFSGHVHSYQRTFAVKNNGTSISKNFHNPNAPVYVVAGGAGSEEGLTDATEHKSGVPWSAHMLGSTESAGVLSVIEDDANQLHKATWTLYRSHDHGVEDQFTISKDMM
jgi:hypothetical protein